MQDDNLELLSDQLAYLAEQETFPGSDNISLITFRMENPRCTNNARASSKSQHGKPASNLKGAIEEINKAIQEFENEMRNK
jgi:hypothetical protein